MNGFTTLAVGDLPGQAPPAAAVSGSPPGKHARRRDPGPGWGIVAVAVLTVPLGLGLGWFGPDLIGAGPGSPPGSRYEPDIPGYPTTPGPAPRRAPAAELRPSVPAGTAPAPTAPSRRTAPGRHATAGTTPPGSVPPLVTSPSTADPLITASSTSTSTSVFLRSAPLRQTAGHLNLTYPGAPR